MNLLANGDIAPTYPGINIHFGAVVEDGAVTLPNGHAYASFDTSGPLEAGKEYACQFTISNLLPGTIVRARTCMTTSGAGATGDFEISEEGSTAPLAFASDGNENSLLVTIQPVDETVTTIGATISAVDLHD